VRQVNAIALAAAEPHYHAPQETTDAFLHTMGIWSQLLGYSRNPAAAWDLLQARC
jgi:hypothetical protein